jgi:uncharacterized membrane protein YhaH (DUF805 family)
MTAAMTPVDWVKRPIEKYADFTGRASRSEYWWYVLALCVAYLVLSIVESIVGLNHMFLTYGPLSLLLMLGTLIPSIAVGVRRLHDTNRPGWWLLIALVPYGLMALAGIMAVMGGGLFGFMAMMGLIGIVAMIGGIVLLIFMVLPGTPGDNQYGPNPSGDGTAAIAAE